MLTTILLLSIAINDPIIIAHRGASATLPEHTLEAYTLAYAQGADCIEPDVVLTKDHVLVCCHDLTVSNEAAMRELYPDRARADGKWYVIDFTLAELRAIGETIGRNDPPLPGTTIATLDEMIKLVQRLNERTGREVSIIPEPKKPSFHRAEGYDISAALVGTLRSHGYHWRGDGAIIQCFEVEALERMRLDFHCELRLVYLSSDPISDETLDHLATFADGIGPSRKLIEDEGEAVDPGLVTRAHERGLAVYAWTFGTDAAMTDRFLHEYRVDGVFTDNPDVGVEVRDGVR
ncbi:MAG: glycerophosphodiester phosphodiesterase family protein [Phycisphaerales bacterium]